ncbi:1-acylglycerol-3-phosphate O-acyltransferase ABHD5 [Ctenopharyngodon idella]|uniref:1-acylglycerol-3-phosphate O-acyltransferase ABHD5 n=1 Tax=Ctenopharyngodon idella TaxID=7959 RepID=UPI00222F3779|nr:1-acylglycerol-3-phosphate O-acyltransferase ABHD5 [Ctenopharyngodon idella]XP_051729774.1 1-acylglycerol-3-phosphate O-acyltransferase ABHD5 [Ctenopharyngodon idella]
MRTNQEEFVLTEGRSRCISSWLPSWCPTSLSHLIKSEDRILKPIKVKFTQGHVPISNGNYIWTLGFNEVECSSDLSTTGVQQLKVPLVLLHGFGGGVGLWVKNLSAFAGEGRPVYALDMLGFGRSSRPTFGRDAKDAEEQFVQSLEDWRKAEGLEHMILLGHDLGGYVSTAYALKYPHRLKHLVLVEPWGFAARPNVQERWVPIWIKAFGAAMNPFNPLGPLRLAGPLGPLLLQVLRSDFKQKYASVFADDTVADYIYHVNAQTASGETAFKNMTIPYGWPQHPMMEQVEKISPSLPMTFIYGSRSSIEGQSGKAIQEMRPNSQTKIIVIQGAGHYVFADQSEDFNQAVLKICNNEC